MSSIVHVLGGTLVGVDAVEVAVETSLLSRLPAVVVVGLPASSVRESAYRVRSAILGAGMEFPQQRVVISLAPADLRKDGLGLDLPIAVSVLAAAGQVPEGILDRYMFIGELSLAGDLRPVRGALAYAELAKRLGKVLVVPLQNGAEAALVRGLEVVTATQLQQVVDYLRGTIPLANQAVPLATSPHPTLDMRDIVGQAHARLALEVAAAGGHRLLLVGSPGCGKTMLAARLPGILPTMSAEETLEVVRISSVAGLRAWDGYLPNSRPFRAPHHSISLAGLVGGTTLRPGELTLAHRGVLFLDELDQFERATETSLKICMGQTISGGGYGLMGTNMPGSALLVAAMNPCPCGFRGHPTRACVCGAELLATWNRRAAASPLRPTFDLEARLEPTRAGEFLPKNPAPECSAAVRERVTAARERQMSRQGCLNSRTDFPRVERVAWTLADLEGVEVSQRHRDAAAVFMGVA